MRNELTAIVLVILVAGSLGVGYLEGSINVRSLTTTSIMLLTTTTSAASTTISTASTTSTCPVLVGCGPSPVLNISGAEAQIGSNGPSLCQTTNWNVVCGVRFIEGETGKVMVNVTYRVPQPGTYQGGADVAFLVYSSSAPYVNFTSIPTCASTSGPSLDVGGCKVPSNGETEFQFYFAVSTNYNLSNQRWPDSVTVSMEQTCCFP